MSARQAKAARRAEGLSKQALRAQREFELQVARHMMDLERAQLERVADYSPRRRRLAWIALAALGAALLAMLGGRL